MPFGPLPLPAALNGPLAASIRASAEQIWQAGLGAFAKAQDEGGKVFDALVNDGVALQRKTQAAASDALGGLGETVSRLGGPARVPAAPAWDRLETIFEDRVAKALARLDVPTRAEFEALQARVDALAGAPAQKRSTTSAPRAAPPARKKR